MFRPPFALAIVFMFLPPVAASAQDADHIRQIRTPGQCSCWRERPGEKSRRRAGFRAGDALPRAAHLWRVQVLLKNGKCNDARNK